MFYHCFRAATDICWVVKMISSLVSIEIHVHVIDNSNNEIRGGGVERDAGGDEKQLIKFAWPNHEIFRSPSTLHHKILLFTS